MRITVAYSGGLDTTYCVAWLTREQGAEVTTVTVDTGGMDAANAAAIRRRALAAGAVEHRLVDARQKVWDNFVSTLIRGNVLRGAVYPVSVAAERTQQAVEVARVAVETGAEAIAHGATGAGNDQVRFDIAWHVLVPGLPIVAPVREHAVERERSIAYLTDHGIELPPQSDRYSVNAGLWGTTLGGGWTHDPWQGPPADAWPGGTTADPEPTEIVIGWRHGLPWSLDGEALAGPELVEAVDAKVASYGIGRGIHLGETVLGIKGRIGFVAGAAQVLVTAHRELEKLVLTRWQSFWKDHSAQFWGDRLHEGQAFDPVMRDIEALIASSQDRVAGDTRIRLDEGRFLVTGVRSPHSLMNPEVAAYGESHALWTGDEARAFAAVSGIPSRLATAAGEKPSW
ncbi:MAG: argininosuccinate synthase domain-containing protein [Thermoanaerobaculales bacterium]|jgi:argininosuccinate synthase|nr:argininosuccinate synthase domain-containing protein [Thermoanaerobaculales bacterium]